MYNKIDLGRTIFIDIETVPEFDTFDDLPDGWAKHWRDKWLKTRNQRYKHVFERDLPDASDTSLDDEARHAYREAGLYAEFGKICCITLGRFKPEHEGQAPSLSAGQRHMFITSLTGTDEATLLRQFGKVLERYSSTGNAQRHNGKLLFDYDFCLVGHNVREFDIPYICRRMLVNNICLPQIIDCSGLKPWEVKHVVDTMELWKFGDFKAFTSLDLLCQRFNIPSPKQEMSGAGVYDSYLQGDLESIGRYCGQDVLVLAQLLLRWRGEELLAQDEIEIKLAPVKTAVPA